MTGVGRLHALRTEQVLHAIRHALQRQQLVLRPRLVSSVSGSKRMIRRFNDEGIERLGGGNIRIECVGHFTGSEFALAEAIADSATVRSVRFPVIIRSPSARRKSRVRPEARWRAPFPEHRSEEKTYELQSLMRITYDIFF